jgi:hypothetical protein
VSARLPSGITADRDAWRASFVKPAQAPVTEAVTEAIARLNRATWDQRVIARTTDVRALLDAYRALANPEPTDGKPVWYRGWEADYSHDAAMWSGEGWHACLGGADLDCVQVMARTWEGLLDEIDDHDMTEALV